MKNTNKNKTTKKLPVPGKVKKGFRLYCAAVLALAFTLCCSVTAFAAGDPITVVNNLSDFIFGLIRAVGLILLGWGIVQVGLSFQSHDPCGRHYHYLCQRDFDADYRLTERKTIWKNASAISTL